MANPEYFAYMIVEDNNLTTFGASKESLEAMEILNNTKVHTDSFKKKQIKPSDTCVHIRLALNPDDPTEDWTKYGSPIMENGMGGNIVGYWPLNVVDMYNHKQTVRIVYPKFTIKCEVKHVSQKANDKIYDEPEETEVQEENTMDQVTEQVVEETTAAEAETTEVVETPKKKLPKWAKFALVGAGVAAAVGTVAGILLVKKGKNNSAETTEFVEE
jgi:hypothetical protein